MIPKKLRNTIGGFFYAHWIIFLFILLATFILVAAIYKYKFANNVKQSRKDEKNKSNRQESFTARNSQNITEIMNNTHQNSSSEKRFWGFSDRSFIDEDFQREMNPTNIPLSYIDALRKSQLSANCAGFVLHDSRFYFNKKQKIDPQPIDSFLVNNEVNTSSQHIYGPKYSCIFLSKTSFSTSLFKPDNTLRSFTILMKKQVPSTNHQYCVNINIGIQDPSKQIELNRFLNKFDVPLTLEQARIVCDSYESCIGFSMNPEIRDIGKSSTPVNFYFLDNIVTTTVTDSPIYIKSEHCSKLNSVPKNSIIQQSLNKYASLW